MERMKMEAGPQNRGPSRSLFHAAREARALTPDRHLVPRRTKVNTPGGSSRSAGTDEIAAGLTARQVETKER
jgi:hypothetical protein